MLENRNLKIEMSPVSGKGIALPDPTDAKEQKNGSQLVFEREATAVSASKQAVFIGEQREKNKVSFPAVFGQHTEVCYGYWGRSAWLGDITLYWGGGVAKLKNITSSELQQTPYYGDYADDHWNIKLGIDMFDDSHSNAPIGHNGILTEAQIAAQVLSGLGY